MRKTITLITIGGGIIYGMVSFNVGVNSNICPWVCTDAKTLGEADKTPKRLAQSVQHKTTGRNEQRPIASRSLTHKTYQSTAYTWTGNRTASGIWPVEGRTIAINPKRFRLGQRIYIQGLGWRIAEDIIPPESVAKGADIDLFVGSEAEAVEWGRRNMRVERRE